MKKLLILKTSLLAFFLLAMAQVVNAASLTVNAWGTSSCSLLPSASHGNQLCVTDDQSTKCKGTAGNNNYPSSYIVDRTDWGGGYLYRLAFSCSGSGTTRTCNLATTAYYTQYSTYCRSTSTQSQSLVGASTVVVTLPEGASNLVYGNDTHAICYLTSYPTSVQCRKIFVNINTNIDTGIGTVQSWGFDPPVTIFTAEELFFDADTDGDGIGDNADWDDDNDGVPDTVDAAPLDASNTSEIVLPLDGVYKGMRLQNNATH